MGGPKEPVTRRDAKTFTRHLRLLIAREGHLECMTTAQQVRPRPAASLFPTESSRLTVAIAAVLLAALVTWVCVTGLVLQRVF